MLYLFFAANSEKITGGFLTIAHMFLYVSHICFLYVFHIPKKSSKSLVPANSSLQVQRVLLPTPARWIGIRFSGDFWGQMMKKKHVVLLCVASEIPWYSSNCWVHWVSLDPEIVNPLGLLLMLFGGFWGALYQVQGYRRKISKDEIMMFGYCQRFLGFNATELFGTYWHVKWVLMKQNRNRCFNIQSCNILELRSHWSHWSQPIHGPMPAGF